MKKTDVNYHLLQKSLKPQGGFPLNELRIVIVILVILAIVATVTIMKRDQELPSFDYSVLWWWIPLGYVILIGASFLVGGLADKLEDRRYKKYYSEFMDLLNAAAQGLHDDEINVYIKRVESNKLYPGRFRGVDEDEVVRLVEKIPIQKRRRISKLVMKVTSNYR